MGMRGSMWIKDSQGQPIKGSSKIQGREESIEVFSMHHKISSPTDLKTGKLTGNRTHTPITIVKQIDQSTPFFNKACCSGECLKDITVSLYNISQSGKEEEYFRYTLSNARIMAIQPMIGGTENADMPDREKIAVIYETIEWQHIEGNYAYSDSWNARG